jgi:hypothetical protein
MSNLPQSTAMQQTPKITNLGFNNKLLGSWFLAPLSIGDSMLATTAHVIKATCITDGPRFKQIKEIQTAWI